MNLQDRVALVTGGASGLGKATAQTFMEQGAKVFLLDRDAEYGQAAADEMGDAAHFLKTDVTNEDNVQSSIQAAVQQYGGVHVAVNCAGVGGPMRVLGREGPMPLDVFTTIININLVGTFNVIRLVANAMSQNEPNEDGERGVIINTASVAAYDGQIGQAAYSASKGGIVGMTLPIARELARFGIRVMTIAPGIFDTPMLAALPEAARQSLGEQVPFPPRLGKPAEYAALAKHIVENPMLNGEVIRLDGSIRMAPK